jgi:hypothetical protein
MRFFIWDWHFQGKVNTRRPYKNPLSQRAKLELGRAYALDPRFDDEDFEFGNTLFRLMFMGR